MSKSITLALIFALLSATLCDNCDMDVCRQCHDDFPMYEAHVNAKLLGSLGKILISMYCNENVLAKYPCSKEFCKDLDKNVANIKAGTDKKKFCRTLEMC
ncbi:hypothetical protein GCK32_014747 [Trichostrongylus colubriformis]|uniref:Saposin B-type domain-containing protein n=1 Tax=Trichostrongylus colubriformis TaxID=6319 RepID=A0AAN8GDE1_TRICO